MAKQKFEDEWQVAFEKAEASPSEGVWTGIELGLEKASGTIARKQLVRYQWLVAASVTFAIGITALYLMEGDQQSKPALTSALSGSPGFIEDQLNKSSDQGQVDSDKEPVGHQQSAEQTGDVYESHNANALPVKTAGVDDNMLKSKVADNGMIPTYGTAKRKMPALYTFRNPEIVMPKSESAADPGMVLLAKLADKEKALSKKEDKRKMNEQLWTTIGFGAGTFNPNASSAKASGSFNATGNSSAGMSYSVGAGVGGRVGSRFVLQGGVAYLSQNASFTSSSLSMEATTAVASLDDYIDRVNNLVATSPYEVSSNLQYVSLPLQAGYVLVDRDFAVQVNGGVATDFFVQNTLTPDAENIAGITQKAGDDSPYRSVNFSGIVGTELSYKLGRYRIALNPGIRYALNSIYKAEIEREIAPVTYDVSVRLRYLFN